MRRFDYRCVIYIWNMCKYAATDRQNNSKLDDKGSF